MKRFIVYTAGRGNTGAFEAEQLRIPDVKTPVAVVEDNQGRAVAIVHLGAGDYIAETK